MKLDNHYTFNMDLITNRTKFKFGGIDGGLNANYRQVDAVARIAEICCRIGLVYGRDWYWETCQSERIFLSFSDEKYATMVTLALGKGYDEH